MEPARAGERRGPVHVGGCNLRERRARAIVHDAHGAQVGARLDEVQAKPRAAAQYAVDCHAFAPQGIEPFVAQGAFGETRDIRGRDAEVSQRDGDVGLGAAEEGMEHRRLEQSLLARRAEAEQ